MTDPWALAHEAAAVAGVALRPMTSVADAVPIGEVIAATWGEQPVGPEIVRALAESGNEPYGAFDGDTLVGFVLGWAGVDRDGLHVHSHMLAALPDRRHAGCGYALKLAQRAHALERGIHVVRWTFDPLIARNAYFNLAKLGATADRFERAYYGEMADALNRDDRSDRLTARWHLDPEPGHAAGSGAPTRSSAPAPAVLERIGDPERPEPKTTDVHPDADVVSVEVPPEYLELRARDAGLATAWRDAVAVAIEDCIARGLVATGFARERSAYVFSAESA